MSRSISALPELEKLPALGKAIVKATNRQPHQKKSPDRREISIDKGWTACLVCWGGPLDLSTVQNKHNVTWSYTGTGERLALSLRIKLWIASTQYTAKFIYYLERQESCISNRLNNGFKLGPVMTAAGFGANQKIFVQFIHNQACVEARVLRDLDAI